MSEDSLQVVLVRLDHLSEIMDQIHEEVKKTNGRVTELELESARREGHKLGRGPAVTIFTTVTAYSLVALVIWFVAHTVTK